MEKIITYIVIFLTLLSCDNQTAPNIATNEIEIGDFVFQFPENFKLVKENGVDSYVGHISDGKIDFHFDYGYYSNSLDKSISEFLAQDVWKWNALGRHGLLHSGAELSSIANEIILIDCQTRDSLNYINSYLYKGDTIDYELTIPSEIRNVKIEMDTIDNITYKLVRKSNVLGLYAKNLNGFNKSINSHIALSITTSKLNNEEIKTAYEILRSCKLKK